MPAPVLMGAFLIIGRGDMDPSRLDRATKVAYHCAFYAPFGCGYSVMSDKTSALGLRCQLVRVGRRSVAGLPARPAVGHRDVRTSLNKRDPPNSCAWQSEERWYRAVSAKFTEA